jgi:hypothetical protein
MAWSPRHDTRLAEWRRSGDRAEPTVQPAGRAVRRGRLPASHPHRDGLRARGSGRPMFIASELVRRDLRDEPRARPALRALDLGIGTLLADPHAASCRDPKRDRAA